MDILRMANERAASGDKIYHLEVGQPGRGAPRAVIEAAGAALRRGRLGYTEALGLSALRCRIARHYGDNYGLDIAPARVVVTTGSSGGFILALLAAVEEGAAVGWAVPGYPAYRNILKALGNRAVPIQLGPETRFSLTANLVETMCAAHRLDGLIIASPANPTGSLIAPNEMNAIVQLCAERGIWLISDEIYHGLTFAEPARTALSANDDVIVVNSFSKYFRMTGWRVGWLIVPEILLRPIERLAQSLFISAPALSQEAAIAAFDAEEELEISRKLYLCNRDFLLANLPTAGFGPFAPADGAFYLYTDVSALTQDSVEFCRVTLDETGVALTPGNDFDPQLGHRYIRISYAGEHADIAEAAARLVAGIRR
jgi:aspartate/methionine/tyrosine aminotransferase